MIKTKNIKEKIFQKLTLSIKSLLMKSQIFGLITFSSFETNFYVSRIRTAWNILLNTIYSLFCGFCIYKFSTNNKMSIVMKAVSVLILTSSLIFTQAVWLTGLIKSKKIIEFLYKIIEFDIKLKQTSYVVNYDWKKKKYLKITVTKYLFYLISSILNLSHIKFSASSEFGAHLLGLFFSIINSVMAEHIVALVLRIRTRFVIINKQIDDIIKFFSNNLPKKRLELRQKSIDFGNICAMHHYLTKLIKFFNEIFGVILLLFFGTNFMIITQAMFLLAGDLQSTKIVWIRVFYVFLGITVYGINTVIVCDACFNTIQEVVIL